MKKNNENQSRKTLKRSEFFFNCRRFLVFTEQMQKKVQV